MSQFLFNLPCICCKFLLLLLRKIGFYLWFLRCFFFFNFFNFFNSNILNLFNRYILLSMGYRIVTLCVIQSSRCHSTFWCDQRIHNLVDSFLSKQIVHIYTRLLPNSMDSVFCLLHDARSPIKLRKYNSACCGQSYSLISSHYW